MDTERTQNTHDTDHIISLINMGVDFGRSMSAIRTLVDEINYLRDYIENLEHDHQLCHDELQKAMAVIATEKGARP